MFCNYLLNHILNLARAFELEDAKATPKSHPRLHSVEGVCNFTHLAQRAPIEIPHIEHEDRFLLKADLKNVAPAQLAAHAKTAARKKLL